MKKILKFFWEDFKSDLMFIREVLRGEHKPKYKLDDFLNLDGILTRQNLILFLIVLAAFGCGWIVASAKYDVFVNNYILEHCTMKDNISEYFLNQTWRKGG